jgi:hypothetical protein
MLTTHKRFTTLIPFLLTLAAGCAPAAEAPSGSPFCETGKDVNESCRYEVGEAEFWLTTSDLKMRVETPLELRLRSSVPVQVESSELRGLSMYMGRIPVIWEPVNAHEWRAQLQLGACTDPDMRWQLELNLTNENGSHQWQLPFSSSQP